MQAYNMYRKKDFEKADKIIKEIYAKFLFEIKNDKDLKRRIIKLEKKIVAKKNPYLCQSNAIFKTEKTENAGFNKEELSKNPDELHNKFYLALRYFEHSDFERSINTLLEILKIDKNWNNKNAHNFLLKIFSFLGSSNKISIEGKKNLSMIIF